MGMPRLAELHWYYAEGAGKVDMKVKKFLD